jgi:hypothetical protein
VCEKAGRHISDEVCIKSDVLPKQMHFLREEPAPQILTKTIDQSVRIKPK